jgi:PIN domain nuclease of toxin-antitoxin system
MRVLLDAHVLLCAVAGSPLLKPAARQVIQAANEVRVSAASIWEVASKARLGMIKADAAELVTAIDTSGFIELPVRAAHAAAVAGLAPHHADPFDRLLIAQAMVEPLADAALAPCSDPVTLI